MNRKGIRVTFDAPDPEPRKLKDMKVWKCYSCQKRFSVEKPDTRCPYCRKITEWILMSTLPEGHVVHDELDTPVKDVRANNLRNVLVIGGSARPCKITTCVGEMVAYLHHFKDGGFKLIFTCDRCHEDYIPGLGTAITSASREPQNAEEALA